MENVAIQTAETVDLAAVEDARIVTDVVEARTIVRESFQARYAAQKSVKALRRAGARLGRRAALRELFGDGSLDDLLKAAGVETF